MGGHGGLNILPQKKWNVYNWDNRIKLMQNEKIVNNEIEKMKIKHKHKKLEDKVKSIKNPNEKFTYHEDFDDVDKNKIFREVMQRESMTKKLNTDLFFEKMNTPMKSEEQLKFFDQEYNVEKLINPESDENKITIKDSIKSHLNPWWMKRKMEDFEIYREMQEKKELEEKKLKERQLKLLKKKHKKEKRDKRKEGKPKDGNEDEKKKKEMIEKLRNERVERERIEKERIKLLLTKNNK